MKCFEWKHKEFIYIRVSPKIFKKGAAMIPIVLYKDTLGDSKLCSQKEKEERKTNWETSSEAQVWHSESLIYSNGRKKRA